VKIWIALFAASLAVSFTFGQTHTVERFVRTTTASTRLQLRAEVESATAQAGSIVRIKLVLKNIHSTTVHLDDSLF